MGKNTAYGNHRAINPNYFEQNEQEAGQVDSCNKNYSVGCISSICNHVHRKITTTR